MATAFDSFDFAGSDRWREIENNLYFTDNNPKEQARIILKRKRKWFKANIDANFEWDENEGSSSSSSNTTSSNSSEQTSSKPQPSASYTPPPSSSPRSSSASSGSSASSASSFSKTYGIYISWAQLAIHVLIILNVLTYLLPLAGAEQQSPSFWRVMLLNLAAQVVYLLRQHGRPRWNADYGRLLIQDEQAHFLFLSIVLMNATPTFILLAPFLSRSVLFVCGGLKQILPNKAPKIYSLVQRPIEAVVSRYSEIYAMNATLEVLGGVFLLVNLLTPNRNFMLLFGFGQYLRIRFMLSEDAKRAWAGVRVRTDGWVAHPMVPAIVRTGYTKVQGLMESMTDQEQMAAQAAQPGIMNKCTIQ